jgi:hypothetical protein
MSYLLIEPFSRNEEAKCEADAHLGKAGGVSSHVNYCSSFRPKKATWTIVLDIDDDQQMWNICGKAVPEMLEQCFKDLAG